MGKPFFHAPGAEQPFLISPKMANGHAFAAHPDSPRLVILATNSGSNGNGRRLKNREYLGNFSPDSFLGSSSARGRRPFARAGG